MTDICEIWNRTRLSPRGAASLISWYEGNMFTFVLLLEWLGYCSYPLRVYPKWPEQWGAVSFLVAYLRSRVVVPLILLTLLWFFFFRDVFCPCRNPWPMCFVIFWWYCGERKAVFLRMCNGMVESMVLLILDIYFSSAKLLKTLGSWTIFVSNKPQALMHLKLV